MDRRGLGETVGITLACGLATAGLSQVVAGRIDWVFVVGVGVCAGIAAAANYRARTGHAATVAETAPEGPTPADVRVETEPGPETTESSDVDVERAIAGIEVDGDDELAEGDESDEGRD